MCCGPPHAGVAAYGAASVLGAGDAGAGASIVERAGAAPRGLSLGAREAIVFVVALALWVNQPVLAWCSCWVWSKASNSPLSMWDEQRCCSALCAFATTVVVGCSLGAILVPLGERLVFLCTDMCFARGCIWWPGCGLCAGVGCVIHTRHTGVGVVSFWRLLRVNFNKLAVLSFHHHALLDLQGCSATGCCCTTTVADAQQQRLGQPPGCTAVWSWSNCNFATCRLID